VKIAQVHAFQIFDSRGNPTVQADIVLENGVCGHGLVPSGASTGSHEALELRDGNPHYFRGKSVTKAVSNVNGEIAQVICGMECSDQASVDETLIKLDGTHNKARLGANAILAVSMAAADACAKAQGRLLYECLAGGKGTLLPLPEIQIIGGGVHAAHRTDVQDFMLVAVGAKTYEECLAMTFNVYHAAGDLLRSRGKLFGLADEGGFWPEFSRNEEVLLFLLEAIENAGYKPGEDLAISLDIAASEFYEPETGSYRFGVENRQFSSEQFIDLIIQWCEKYPIISLEDPMAESDWDGWAKIRAALGSKIQLVGDDLFCTNRALIERGINARIANAVLIKPNQIGTITETIAAIRLTQQAGWQPIVSARSGETEDTFISHLAVATDAGQLKVGAFSRGERMAKWNEVIRIQKSLGDRARFLGSAIFREIRSAIPDRS